VLGRCFLTVAAGGSFSPWRLWQRKVLAAEDASVNKRTPKHNFTEPDLYRIVITVCTKDDLQFIPERYRVQFTFLVCIFCWTGTRLGVYFADGLRYRDITMVLQRAQGSPWKVIYNIDQRSVKNNRDAENTVFGAMLQEHGKFVYDDASFLLTMAFADRVLFGYATFAELQEKKVPRGQDGLVLRWRKFVLNKPVLRKCTKAGGVVDEPMP
jgi:hypothetical protein